MFSSVARKGCRSLLGNLSNSVSRATATPEGVKSGLSNGLFFQRLYSMKPGLAAPSNFKSMNFVQSILDEDEQSSRKKKVDFVHISLSRKKAFVAVTDAMGNKKIGASGGCLQDRSKGRSRYVAEATAEHVGRSARKIGLNAVVVKVKGFVYFNKKRKVISSWREGFRGEGVTGRSRILSFHDVTQLPHNGCRLPKKTRK